VAETPRAAPDLRCGWESDFPSFRSASPTAVRSGVTRFSRDSSPGQARAWEHAIPVLQREVSEVCERDPHSAEYTAILEYELPHESRRADAVFLVRGNVVVAELKGREVPSSADLDQASSYGRDLRSYHRACAERTVHVVVVPMLARGYRGERAGIHIAGPDVLDELLVTLQGPGAADGLNADEFLDEEAFSPLPTLVRAARQLLSEGNPPRIRRASANTQPAVDEILRIAHEAARTSTRHLVLLTGVPGAGKTLVGLQIAHSHQLDDLSVPRARGKPTAPAVFLSGNKALVQVLQYELKGAGGGGKTFVRGVRDYVKRYSRNPKLIPPEQVLVFDEAQRAWDRDRVAEAHESSHGKSEHELFIEFAERIPGWCVVVALLGLGQEILGGEEGGITLWHEAVENCPHPEAWTIHGPPQATSSFGKGRVPLASASQLNLDAAVRFHGATRLHDLVNEVLKDGVPPASTAALADELANGGFHLRVTREVQKARDYLHERYLNEPQARYGLLASSRDKSLVSWDVDNDQRTAMRLPVGPWFGEGASHPKSCCHLREVATEFQVQGLELDGALLAWGTDFVRKDGTWSDAAARRHKYAVRDALALRVNAYRVLLTRARDGTIVFVPPTPELDETYEHIVRCGFQALSD
jgi:hypothetical protein